MTEPTAMADRYLDCGSHINMVYDTGRALRTTFLDRYGISLAQSHILDKAAGKTPDQLIRELIPTLAERTGEDDAAIASAIEQLCQRGLSTTGTDGTLEITPEGKTCSSKWKPANYSWTPSSTPMSPCRS